MRLRLWGNFADPVNTRRAPGGVCGESPRRAPCGAQAPGRDRPARLPAALSRRVAPVRQAAVVALVAVAALFALAAPAQAQTEPVWSTTMTVGETTGGGRGYYYEDEYLVVGALDIRSFKAGSTDYSVRGLVAGSFAGTGSDDGLAFWVSSAFSDYADYTLEFAGETLPLADGTVSSVANVVKFSAAWLTTNAPSLSTAQFETTLAIGAQVQACLRTATQVCPPRTEAVWSATMTVGETTEDTVGFSDATSTSGGSLDPESFFTTAGSTYTVNQLDVGTYEDGLKFKISPNLSSRASYTLEFAGETLPLSDSSYENGGFFNFTWLAANAPSLSETQFETTLVVDNEVAVCLRTASQVCPGGTTIVPTSSDATLSGLALADSNGNTISLGETFVPATTAYAAFVANGIDTVTLTATKNDSNATVAITSDDDTTSRDEAELDLMVGPNTLTVTVTAQDGATMQPYTITVTRAAACTDVWCATLTVQSLSDGRFGCASSQSGKECSAYLTEDEFTHDSTDYEVSGLQLTANGELRLFLAPPNGLTTASQSLVLLVGSERFPFAYADTKEGRARYWTNSGLNWSSGDIVDVRLVEATASNDTTLSDLEIVDSNGDTVALSPPFADDETDYTASVEDGVLQVTVTAAASDASNKLDYLDRNGNALSDADTGATGHQVVLDAGETVVQVQVTAEDGATMTYRVSVMRMLTTGATVLVSNLGEGLSNVTSGYNVTGQSFTTGSNPGGYRLTAVAVRVSSHNNFASDSDTHVTLWSIVNNGPDAMIAELTSPPLGTGTRTYTAPAGVFLDPNRSYRVQLNYGLSQNSRAKVRLTLSNRETSGYGWTIGDRARYNASSHPTSWITLDAAMSMRIEGEELPTSTDATLSGLALKNASDDSAVALNETFSSTLTTYTATVANAVTSITVEPTPGNASAEVAYLNASDVELTDADPNKTGFQADLTEGDNVIQVQVTAQDDNTTLTYEVTVRREAATTANAVWSTTMTVGVATGGRRGYKRTGFGSLDKDSVEIGIESFDVDELSVQEGNRFRLYFNTTLTDDDLYILEIAGEEFPLDESSRAANWQHYWTSDWVDSNAPSLNSANLVTTLPEDARVPVCLRTATQVCPGGTTIIPTSTDATLSGLAVNDGATDHTIDLATTPYTLNVGNAVTTVTLTATPTHTGASVSAVTLGGSAIADTVFTDGITVPSLIEGDNEIDVTVTAEDTTTMKTYMVTVTREDTTTTTAPAIVTDGVQVTSTPAAGDTYGLGETIEITVTFDTAVTVDTSGGTPRIRFVLNGGGNRVVAWAEYSSGSGGTALVFTYTVQADDLDDDGIWLPADFLQLQSGTIRDAADNTVDATLTYVAPGTQNEHKVDGGPTTTAPAIVTDGVQVTSTPMATADTYGLGETIEITVTFDTAVTVDTSGGTPRIQFRLGPPRTDKWAEYSSGSGGTALVFTYTVQSGDLDDDGIWLPADYLELQSGTIRDAADNTVDATLTYLEPGLQTGHKVNAPTEPGAPTSLTATASGTTTIDLSWTAPGDNGGSAITGYRIEVSPNGSSGWTNRVADTGTTATTYSHTGLSAGTTRHYRVSAINSVGTGDASNVDDATTDDATTTNTAATGMPTISGTAQVGEILMAFTSSISDADGKTKAENGDTGYAYTYQWILVDGNNETEISGETSSAYTPSSSDVGKTIRVKVSFIDDLDNAEGPFTSDQTAAVTVANLLWSTTMTVGEGSSGGRGYFFDEAVGELVIDSVDSFEIGSTDYQVLALLAGPYAGDSSKGLVFWTNNAILSYAEYTLEFAGETLPLADATPNNTGKILEFSPEWLTANASTLNAANFETTLPVNAMAPVCLRTATEVCPGGGITTTNTPATGQPGISGTPQVGQMLTAGIGTIADVDDLPPTVFPAGYSFQWVRVDSSNNETDVGTDSIGFPVRSTYSPTSLDVGSTIKVKVSFIDNAGNSEGPLTSDAYPASGTIAPASTTPPPDTDVLVGNTGEALLLGGTSSIGAQSLVTGFNAGGYAVSAVQIRLKSVSGKTTVVKIREDNNGEPGDLVATLTNPASLSAHNINTFTAPPGTTLAASTTYWITRGEGMTFAITAATDETGEPGWSIGDSRLYRTSETLPWFTSTQSSLMIAIKGAAIGAASDDATLSALTVNDGTSDLTLDPAFAPGTFAYAADVDNAVTTVTLTAMTTDDGASVNAVTLGGIAIADTDFTDGITVPSLLVDDNDIVVTVTAENGDTRTYTLTVTRQTAVNNPATGAPAISGTAQVGQTLTAATTDIADADGLANPSYDYQWVRVDGSSETDIAGATSSTYMPVAADVGKKLKVKVSFTDDASNNEELTSDAYPESRTVEAASTTAPTTVTISADKTSAVFKEDDITYTVTRTGSTTAALPVTVLLTQTADFLAATELTKTVTIGADQSTATFTVAASSFQHFAAGTKVGGGTLTATVQDGSAYNPGTTNSVEVDIVIGVMIGFEMAAYSVDEAISLFQVKVIAHTGPGAGQPTSEATYSILPADDSATNPRDFFFVDIPARFLVNNFLESGAVWQAEHNYVVQITNDQEVEDDETFDLRIERVQSTATYSLVDASGNSCGSVCTATVTIIDDDTPGVTVSPTALTVMEEDTTGDSYTVVLDTEPTANVTVTVAGHSGTDVTPTPVSLTFTASNWDAAQTVTVTAGNDADPVNDEVTLTHSAASTDSGYSSGITIPSVAVTVRDNDTAVAASICGRTDKVRDELLRLIENNVGAAVACADVTTTHLAAITGALDLSGQNIAELTAGDFAGLTGLTELSLYNNKLRSLPGGVFDELGALDILVLARNGLTTLDEDVFDALDKLTELNLQENDLTGLPAGVFDRLRALDILTLDENGLITLPAGVFDRLTELEVLWLDGNDLTELPAGIFNELGALEVLTLRRNSLVRLPDGVFEPLTALKDLWLRGNPGVPFAPGAVALPDDGTVPVAGGAVRLDGRDSGGAWGTNVTYGWALTTPTSGATFNNDTSPTPEVTIEALPANTELTFTLTVTGRGGTDGIDPATDTATVTVTRAASAGVSVTPTALTVTEEDPVGAGYTVVLDTLPMADVTVTVAGHAGTDLTLTPDPVSLTFTPSDWDTAQTVTVTAGDDADKENDTVRLTHAAASRDGNYNGVGIADVAVTVIDNNLVQVTGLTVTPGNTQLMINWTAVGNATGYKVQWKSGSQNYDTTDRQATIALGSTTSHTITGLVNATRYTVRVIATWTGASDGPPSAEAMGRPRGESGGICGRTEEVRGALLDLIEKKEGDIDCADVSAAHLAAITRLDLSGQGIAALKAGDFAGLTGLTQLYLYGNALSSLPGGVFAELSALNNLDLNNNNLSSLPVGVFARLTALTNLTLFNNELTRLSDGVFDGLGSLRALSLDGNGLTALSGGVFDGLTELGYLNLDHNKLTTLPDDVFEPLTALTDLQLVDNDGAPFSPGAVALLPDDGTVPVVGGTVTLDGSDSDGGPWGTNVTYGWALTDPESGVTVTFDDDTSATPVVTIPALAADTELTFTLTVTGGGGAKKKGVVAGADTATVTVTPAARSARSARSAAIPEHDEAESPPLVSVADVKVREGPGAVLAFNVMLDRASRETATVDWETLNGSAKAGEDYVAASGTLAFGPGETVKTVRVAVIDDAHDEGTRGDAAGAVERAGRGHRRRGGEGDDREQRPHAGSVAHALRARGVGPRGGGGRGALARRAAGLAPDYWRAPGRTTVRMGRARRTGGAGHVG